MPIDTTIKGNPESIHGVADWLRSSLKPKLDSGVDAIDRARSTAEGGWDGDAGDSFVTRMRSGGSHAEDLGSATSNCATSLDTAAGAMRRAQDEMRAVCEDAAAAGLIVIDGVIGEPGSAPAEPGDPPTGSAATPEAVSSYNAAVTLAAEHAAKVRAYEAAQHASDAAEKSWKFALDTLKNVWADLTSKWFFVVSDLVNGGAEAMGAAHASTLLKKSEFLTESSARYLQLAKTAPAGTPAALVYRDFDLSRQLTYAADDAAEAAAAGESRAGRIGLKVGGALAAAGVAYDIYKGKDVDQAIVSGGVGFGASVLAGAAIGAVVGSAIPIPGVGTAAGALAGATVGIFASGAVDSIYQNGIDDVGEVASDGADAVVDTGAAVGNLVKGAWDAVF